MAAAVTAEGATKGQAAAGAAGETAERAGPPRWRGRQLGYTAA